MNGEIKFLKVSPGEAIETIEACMSNGYQTLERIIADYQSREDVTTNPTSAWNEWAVTWVNDTLNKLGKIYTSNHRLYNFKNAKTSRYATDGDRPYSGLEHAIEAKIDVLKGYYDFIMSNGEPIITVNGDLVFQQGENINYEKKKLI